MIPASPEWMAEAGCRNAPRGTMYPFGESDEEGIARAKSYCAVCPVLAECLDFAVTRRETNGVWGGMMEKERGNYGRRLRFARQKAAAAEFAAESAGVAQPSLFASSSFT